MKVVEKKGKCTEQHKNVGANEKQIVEEMMKEMIKNFNDDEDCYTNQKIIGHKDMFRGVIVKEWIVGNEDCVDFHTCNNILMKCCVQFCVEY